MTQLYQLSPTFLFGCDSISEQVLRLPELGQAREFWPGASGHYFRFRPHIESQILSKGTSTPNEQPGLVCFANCF